MGRVGVPGVGCPGDMDEASDDDDGVGKGDEGLDDACASFGADQQLSEATAVQGVGSLQYPAGAGLQWETFLADDRATAEFLE